MDEKLTVVYNKLLKIRGMSDLKLKYPPILKKTIVGIDGKEQPLKIRDYQIQMVLHLLAMSRFVVGDDCGLGKCVTPDSLLLTPKGLVPIGSLNPGITTPDTFGKVTGHEILLDGKAVPVKSFYYGGKKPTLKVKTRDGWTIEGSLIHPILIVSSKGEEFVKLADLKLGDLAKVNPHPSEGGDSLNFMPTIDPYEDPIVSIEPGFNEVVDIEVDDPRHCFIANGFVNHNTIQCITTLSHIWDANPDQKTIILTKKSALEQWAGEFNRFTEGVHVFVCKGTPKQREVIRGQFLKSPSPAVLLMGYRGAVQDFTQLQNWEKYALVLDEAQMVCNTTTQVHQVCKHLSMNASRCWGLTATVIKNRLMEAFGVYQVIAPQVFAGVSKNQFMHLYGIVKMQPIKGGRKIPVVVGHRKSQIEDFRKVIDPFFLGRAKHEVAADLPVLTSRIVPVGMTPFQKEKYQEALDGLLTLGTGEEKEVDKLTSVVYCQEIVNHPCLIDCEGESEKLDALVELLGEDGEFFEEKVIVFTRFERMVSKGVEHLTKKGIKSLRVTGKESEADRENAKKKFMDLESGINVIWITTAGGDSINLQAAKALVFYDTPWSAGDYIQILGRMLRIGSIHDRAYALHLICSGTVDDRVMESVNRKMKLIEAVIGKRLKGEEAQEAIFEIESDINAIYDALKQDARLARI